MESSLKLFDDEYCLDEIVVPQPSMIPDVPSMTVTPREVGNFAPYNNDCVYDSDIRPSNMTDQVQEDSTKGNAVVWEGSVDGKINPSTLNNWPPMTSHSGQSNSESLVKAPAQLATQEVLRIPRRNKVSRYNPVSEELKDEKYYENRRKAALRARRVREKKREIDEARVSLLNENLKEIERLKVELKGYKEFEMKYLQLTREYASLYQTTVNLFSPSGRR